MRSIFEVRLVAMNSFSLLILMDLCGHLANAVTEEMRSIFEGALSSKNDTSTFQVLRSKWACDTRVIHVFLIFGMWPVNLPFKILFFCNFTGG